MEEEARGRTKHKENEDDYYIGAGGMRMRRVISVFAGARSGPRADTAF